MTLNRKKISDEAIEAYARFWALAHLGVKPQIGHATLRGMGFVVSGPRWNKAWLKAVMPTPAVRRLEGVIVTYDDGATEAITRSES